MKRVIVCGAGWAGLNAARLLKERGFSVTILERGMRPGGRIRSELIDGFTIDAGFQVVNPAYAELRETGVLARIRMNSLPRGVEISTGNQIRRVGDFRHDLSYLADDLRSWSGSIRSKLAFLRYLRRSAADLSFGAATLELGGLYKNVLAPFLTGVVLTEPAEVSNQMVRELIHWFIKGAPGLPDGGVGAISDELARGLEVDYGVEITAVTKGEVQTSRGLESADAVIIATDPVSAARLLGMESPLMNASATWYFKIAAGLITSKHLRIGGVGPLINSVALSNVAPSYAPTGTTLVAGTTLVSAREAEVKQQLAELWRIGASEFELIARVDIPESLPFHAPGIALSRPALLESGVYVAGDWRNVPSQQGALVSGRIAANAVSAALSTH